MKKSILCLLVLLSLCLCVLLASCKPDDNIIPAPDGGNIGQEGETQADDNVKADVNLDAPNQSVEGSTPRY